MKLSAIKKNPNNPRTIRGEQFERLKRSIQSFPQMMALRPIVTDGEGVVLGGNMRLEALKALGFKEIPDEWVKRADELTEEQRREFVVKDNAGFGEWDWDALANSWDDLPLSDWGVDLPAEWLNPSADEGAEREAATRTLAERFIVPPFSVLDARAGYWQDRKGAWRKLIGDGGESRQFARVEYHEGYKSQYRREMAQTGGVSLLDPVLAEVVCAWFAPPASSVFDCFAGDTVFGYVSAYLGHTFTGIELRQEQADINSERVKGLPARYVCDDGQNVAQHVAPASQDLFFTCPPYFDLEVYSDLPNDASNQKEYADFLRILENAFTAAVACLKENRFAVVVVGDVRDKVGAFRDFVGDVKRIFISNGIPLYNELILVEPVASKAVTAAKPMETRKVRKTHQHVLTFFKGDVGSIKREFPVINYEGADVEQIGLAS